MTDDWFDQLIKDKKHIRIVMKERDDDGWCGIITNRDENGFTIKYDDKDGRPVQLWLPWNRIKEIEVSEWK